MAAPYPSALSKCHSVDVECAFMTSTLLQREQQIAGTPELQALERALAESETYLRLVAAQGRFEAALARVKAEYRGMDAAALATARQELQALQLACREAEKECRKDPLYAKWMRSGA